MLRKPTIWIVALCVVYVAVRAWRLTDACLWFDEIFGVHAADHSWSGMWWFVAQDLIHPPLFYALLKIWIGIGGESLLWLRSFPVFFAILALIPFLNLCRELKLKFGATILALALIAVNGSLIKYAQEVRMYSLLLFLSLLSLWLFSRFFYRGKNVWLLTIVNVLLVYTHYFGWLILLSEVAAIAILQRVKIRHVLIMSGIAAVAFAPWLVAILRAANAGSEISQNIGWIERPGFKSVFDLVFDLFEPFYFQTSSSDPSTMPLITLPILIVFILAQWSYLASRILGDRERLVLLTILICMPVLCAFAISWLSPFSVWGSRHLIVIFAPLCILFAIYLTEISRRTLKVALVSVVCLLTVFAGVEYVRTPTAEQIWCAWGKSVDAEVDRKDGIVYAFEDLAAYHLWYATRLPNTGIVRVNGIEGILEDKAYFLPRGSHEAVRVIDATEVPNASEMIGEKIHFAFRDTVWNEYHPPIDFLKNKGYKVRQVFASDPIRGVRVFLGEATR